MAMKIQDFKGFEFTLDDLVNVASQWIERATSQPIDGRVAPLPDARTVRYYQTLGILHKPLRYEGRNAVYGYHHLLQLIAIKLLQRQGLSLAQIQNALMQATLSDLEKSIEPIFEWDEEPPKERDHPVFSIESPPLSMGRIQEGAPCSESGWREPLQFPIYQRSRKMGARNLIAKEVAPGIFILVDPEVVQNPKELLDWITKFLNPHNGDSE
jgi:DNA-binding transcriptional MerR regulator